MCSEMERGGLLKMVMPGSYEHKKTRQSVHTKKAEAWQVYYLYNRLIDSYLQTKNMSYFNPQMHVPAECSWLLSLSTAGLMPPEDSLRTAERFENTR